MCKYRYASNTISSIKLKNHSKKKLAYENVEIYASNYIIEKIWNYASN